MKKQFLLFLFGCCLQIGHAQSTSSVLSSGDWYQFTVDTSGVFKIDRGLLQQIGISTNGLNPKKIHIYGNGGQLLPVLNSDFRYDDLQENAIYIAGEADGSFDANDFILFYAQGPHDWEVDTFTKSARHRQNIYTDKAYYFITVNDLDGKRIQQKAPITTNATAQITVFDDYTFHEKEDQSILAAGTQWFFKEDFNIENTQSFIIPFQNAVVNQNIDVRIRGVSNSLVASSLDVKINEQDLYSINFSAVNNNSLTKAFASERSGVIANSSENINVTISYNNNGNPSANTFLDYIEISGKKHLKFRDFQFSFRSFEQANSAAAIEYQIENGNAAFQVWDVSNHLAPQSISNQATANNFSFKDIGGTLKEYVILNESDFYTPETVRNSKIKNQNLHALKDINYLVITNAELSGQAQRLADYHQTNSNLTTKVVVLSEIYNEFSSGSKDITGVRDFLKQLYTTNSSEATKLQYVCFFGDASYDYKDRIQGNNNIVPVKLSTNSFNLANSWVTDDFFVMLESNEGTMATAHTIDVVSSRIPVATISEATIVVDKILSYYSKEAIGDWRNTITLLADDVDVAGEEVIQQGVESIADDIKNNKPVFNVNKIYVDAFVQQNSSGGERYPAVNKAITNAIEKGTLVFDYFGHGGEDGFASERILDVPQIQALNNPNTLPLLITVTCDFSRFDNPNRITAGELTLKSKIGGAASMITTTREVFISTGQRFNEQLIRILLAFNNEDFTIAEALKEAKNQFRSTQKFFIYSFGDPAMKLAIPKPNVRITKMNDIDVTQSLDTIKALSKVRFEGVITDDSDAVLTNFNGTLSTTVFDKLIDKKTLGNDGFDAIMPFDTQDSKLFRGKSTVENGQFSFDFIVPKDIKIAFGKGKLSFYAENGETDKAGYNFDVIVGGINENAPEDTVGPEIQLFMNDESFIEGGNTNTSPNLIASLFDMSGINTSITAVDHDIVGILDGDTSNPIILNDFYQTELNDFTKGKVTYRLRDLEVGPHTLKIKAWDTYNNSSETTLNFVVVSDAILNLENVLNYPNPFVNYTEFWFNHNKPNEPLEVQVQIFTVSGKLVKTINRNVQTTGNLSRNITWNGLDDFGNKIGKGVYVYKLSVKSIASNLKSEKYEKLVILQ
ncbi:MULTISPECIES: type IX secretion system sortase PorU [unclassified Polaribacter]|uniref:type IX secretion system sortase PorU n=1 Tax=unclassified Polaribacter TaxID=196858 RepID=UPI0011BD5CD7|nr:MULTISPECIES: type IX secretion system sortase PorU [unclassified Polaribacter]TXD51290.1 type IX secretion system sortase PorU [Polaribacter sp. IC063]TXD58043.1 type IX secretion system sortase PorU [Polaribacter sp. IC066]